MEDKRDEYYLMLDRFIQDSREEMVENLSKLLMFHTVSGSKDPEEQRLSQNEMSRGFSFLSGLARKMGFAWRNYDNRVCVIEQPGGNEVIGLPLHLDVVPSGEGWHYPAFGGMVEDGVIYGRGAQDDKGPIIQMLYGLHAVKRLNLPFRRTVRLIIASQEETGNWTDVEFYLEKEPAPHVSIISDAVFPIVNGEKGMADIKIEIRWKEDLRQSPVIKFHRLVAGERSNIVPNRADISWEVPGGQARGVSETLKDSLETFLRTQQGADAFPLRVDTDPESRVRQLHVTFLGKSAHGSKPEEGHNAAVDALAFLATVPELPDPLLRAAKFLCEISSDHYAEKLGIAAEHGFIGKTTINLGIADVDHEKASVILNTRPTLGLTLREILETVQSRVGEWAKANGLEAAVSFVGKSYEPIYVNPKKHPELIYALKKAYSSVTGQEPELVAESGTTYAKAYPNSLCFGPVDPRDEKHLAHQADECVRIDHLVRNAKIYALALLLLGAELSAEKKVLSAEC